MATTQELQVQQKRELEKREEATTPTRVFVPNADIYETNHALTVILEMPGVEKDNVDVRVEDDVLRITGQLDLSNYKGSRLSTRSTTSATMRETSGSRTRSTRTRLLPS